MSMPSEAPGGAPNLAQGTSAAAAAAAPFASDTLLDRCRALWDQGDWPSLAAFGVAMIEAHPQRASLALMIATAHQALAQDAQTRLFVTLAHQWGCERRLMARALLAGVHNTLGRAGAASGTRRMQTLQHFNEALAAGGTGNAALRLQERLRHQLGTMGLGSEVSSLEAASDSSIFATRAPAPSRGEFDALNRSSRQILARLREQSQQLVAVRRSIEAAVRKEAVHTMAQLEAHASLQHYLDGGQLSPELHGWPVSPDFAVMLIGMVEANDYDLVIEFGSGTSTLLMARALARAATLRGRSVPAVQVAFEHLERFFRQTRSILERADIANAVQLELAPLQPWTSSQGSDYMFYACQRRLAAIVRAAPGPISRALVLVDGPPSATGTHARYPALPIVLTLLPGVAMDVLLDDHDRPDEQQVSAMWVADLQTAGRHAEVSTPNLEKGACLLKLDAA